MPTKSQRVARRPGESLDNFLRRFSRPFRHGAPLPDITAVEYAPGTENTSTIRYSQVNVVGQHTQNVEVQIERGSSESRRVYGAEVRNNTADGVGTKQDSTADGPNTVVAYQKATGGAKQTGKAKNGCVMM